MIAFLRWLRDVALGTLTGIAKFAFFVVLVIVGLFIAALVEGDGLPARMVLNLDLRNVPPDSSHAANFLTPRTPPTIDTVLALDRAGRDSRVKGVFLQLGGGLPVAQAEEISAALVRFRATGRFVIAYAQGFNDTGLGDYLTAASADQIWMMPKSPFGPSGTGSGAIFLKGLFDKINAVPQIVKRADFKSAADMYMEKDFTGPDRVQTTAFLQSWYNSAVKAIALARKVPAKTVTAAIEADPQFAEDAARAHLVDRLGYDGQAKAAAKTRAGGLRTKFVTMGEYARATESDSEAGGGPQVALIEGTGEIVDGQSSRSGFGGSEGMAGDDYADAFRSAARNRNIKAILFRIDSPGGSVTASAQILEALKEAKAAGKPVIVSMGPLAASGGYFVATAADKIVAEPATLTGSIGVLTGKVSFGKSAQMIGVTADDIGIGKNALMDSAVTPYTDAQLANLNHQADVIYADFMQRVADGRKLPIATVQNIARGRVWTGADALPRGLVDELGTFWTAVGDVKTLIGVTPDTRVVFRRYPEKEGFLETLFDLLSGSAAGMRGMEGISVLLNRPGVQETIRAIDETPRAPIELRAVNLPVR